MEAISPLAASAVAVLAPYFAKAGEELAKETGRVAASKIGVLYEALTTQFKDKPTAKEALADLEVQPDDEDAQAALRLQLRKQMNSDPALVELLKQLMSEIEQEKGSVSFLTQVYGGSVGEIINAGTLQGGIKIDKRSGKT